MNHTKILLFLAGFCFFLFGWYVLSSDEVITMTYGRAGHLVRISGIHSYILGIGFMGLGGFLLWRAE